MEYKVGDRIRMKPWRDLWHSLRTRQWMANEVGEILKVNNKTLTVRFDNYPDEKHYVDYGDFDVINDEEGGN